MQMNMLTCFRIIARSGRPAQRENTMAALDSIKIRLREFASERDWDQFHSPKNLAMALIVEAAELVEHFQWLTGEQSQALSHEKLAEVEQEIADIQIYLVRLADIF